MQAAASAKKNVIVTGANSGLGLWTTRHLLDLGYQVILACRDVNKTKQVMAKLPKVYPEYAFRIKKLDLADFTSIRSFVLNLPDDEKIYGLVCNAGISYEGDFRYTKNGIEETFGTNYVGHFLLTLLLVEKFEPARIVVVSSELHNPNNKSPFAKADLKSVNEMAYPKADLNSTVQKQTQSFYATSKLCEVMFTYELARRLWEGNKNTAVKINAINPGLMLLTRLGRTYKFGEKLYRWILHSIFKMIGIADHPKDSGKAVAALIDSCTTTATYYDKFNIVPSSEESYDVKKAKQLWEDTNKLIESIAGN